MSRENVWVIKKKKLLVLQNFFLEISLILHVFYQIKNRNI